MNNIDRLSAIPLFLRHQDFWARVLDPKTHLGSNAKHRDLSISAGSHRWQIESAEPASHTPSRTHLGLIDIAQSILERGVWTVPSWSMEQHLAGLFEKHLGWKISPNNPQYGALGFSIEKANVDEVFRQALVTARWSVEATNASIQGLWEAQPSFDSGSSAERKFLDEVLVPVLGYPLLDYVRLQAPLPALGLDPLDFGGQRTDFVIDSFRGLQLVIEIDGSQHQEQAQALLDKKRDKALIGMGWTVWRIMTSELADTSSLQAKLRKYLLKKDGSAHWGTEQKLTTPRSMEMMTCVWGATVAARFQFLLLECLREGILPWDEPWHIFVVEHDTNICDMALKDFSDWFGRLRELYGLGAFPGIKKIPNTDGLGVDLVIDIAITDPHRPTIKSSSPIASSRPANEVAPIPKRPFTSRMMVPEEPSEQLITSFVQDLFRKAELRDGQQEIISRILRNQDVIGLLPTGGGKSLTYHLCGLLRGGMTIYVSPLKSLLQDQRERLIDCGIDLASEISSALTMAQKAVASQLLTVGGVRFLLVSPERFLIDQFRVDLAQFRAQWGEVSQVVIDECHCVSEWGHDFRPAYLSLSRIVKDRTNRLGVSAPLVALTGTASSIVLADIRRELGVVEDSAVVRAKKLDRPEIDMTCFKLPQKQKHERLQQLVQDFTINAISPSEGLLVFCRFIGSTEGVLAITSELLGAAPLESLRFYCGKNPDWRKYAAFRTKTKATQISDQTVKNVVPVWALAQDGEFAQWEQVKSKVQRDFISGLKQSFPILVATTAFGMGIDKPSVRRVIHVMTPQSPEAYYQEVGRAGRDKVRSQAILLFSDEDAGITDRILAPGASIGEARKIYDDFKKKNKYGGGDFIRTFYFHQNSFLGPEHEARHIVTLLSSIRQRLAESNSLIFAYKPGDGDGDGFDGSPNDWQSEKNLEYAVVRLIILGVVKDYTKDYNSKALSLGLNPDWEGIRDDPNALSEYCADHFRQYVQKYQVNITAKGEQVIRQARAIAEIEKESATSLVAYVYEQIERKRREASRQMLELARKAISDPSGFRQALMLYLQVSEKFTHDLELLANDGELLSWKDLLDRVGTPDEIQELHGACQRVIESYPTHSGLRAISAVTRRNPSADELKRSEEEFDAALKFCAETNKTENAKAMGDTMVEYAERTDVGLTDALQGAFGKWLMKNGFMDEARQRFFIRKPVRDTWIAGVLNDVNSGIPSVRGL